MSKSAIELLRSQYKQSAEWFEATMQGVTEAVATFAPPGGMVSPIAGQAAHAIVGLDVFVLNKIGGRAPLIMTDFADRGVISEPPPESGEWVEWGTRLKVDGAALHEYADVVFASIDELLSGMTDEDLGADVDLGFGVMPVSAGLNIMLMNTHLHTGEIATIKGLQGLKGYPM